MRARCYGRMPTVTAASSGQALLRDLSCGPPDPSHRTIGHDCLAGTQCVARPAALNGVNRNSHGPVCHLSKLVLLPHAFLPRQLGTGRTAASGSAADIK